MKRIHLTVLLFGIILVLASCRGGENKAHPERPDAQRKTEEKIIDNPSSATATPEPDSLGANTAPNEILAKIDQYLVSTPAYTPLGNGDMANVSVTIKNTLKDITFQKAIVEVTIVAADGKALKNDFFTIQNIEPGDTETIKLPNAKGASIVSHVVKVKSNTLTNGEMVLTGTYYDAAR